MDNNAVTFEHDKNNARVPSVAVVMSTYNGEKYLREQIDSILAQKGVHVELFIRDDGSKDSTRDIIADYVKHYDNVRAVYGENLGVTRSFIQALISAPECDYYAFSDQDDYWMPEELISAVNFITQKENEYGRNFPLLYYSNLHVTDSKLNIFRTTKKDTRLQKLGGLIMKRCVPGCTMLMNARLREIIRTHPFMDDMTAHNHDSVVISILLSVGGAAFCDHESYILYRRHEANTSASPRGIRERIKSELHDLKKYGGCEVKIARAILESYDGEIVPEARDILETVASYKENIMSRLKIIFSPKFRTGDIRLTLLGKFKALFGLL